MFYRHWRAPLQIHDMTDHPTASEHLGIFRRGTSPASLKYALRNSHRMPLSSILLSTSPPVLPDPLTRPRSHHFRGRIVWNGQLQNGPTGPDRFFLRGSLPSCWQMTRGLRFCGNFHQGNHSTRMTSSHLPLKPARAHEKAQATRSTAGRYSLPESCGR